MEKEKIIGKIVEETDLTEEKVEEQIEDKMEEFSGLVSEEGAIHLVAKEAGVPIAEAADQELKIKNIVPEMRKVKVKARVVNISDTNTFERDGDEEEGRVRNMTLGDETGKIRMTLWDEQTEIGDKVDEGDAIAIAGAYTVEDNRGNAELRLGDSPQVKMLDDEEVAEVETSSATEAPIREVSGEGNNFEIQGMLMQVYTSNPFYRVDPETGDTVRENDDGELVTDNGKEVEEPEHRLVVSAVIDDGTDNIRVVMFRDQAREVLEVSEEQEKEGDQDAIEKAAEKIKGKQLRIEGRTRYNDYFDTIEMIANRIEEVEETEEIERMLDLLEA